MKKLLLFILVAIGLHFNILAEGIPAFTMEVQYEERNSHLQKLVVRAKYRFNRSITLNSQPEVLLPEKWELIEIDHQFSGEYEAEQELEVNFTLKHNYEDNLPYFPDQLYIEHYGDDATKAVRALFMIYFTPYNTTEVLGEEALKSLKRIWFAKTEEEQERIEINPNEIPESDIPENFEPEEEWQTDYQSIHIPGLAYSIPMMAIPPEEIS